MWRVARCRGELGPFNAFDSDDVECTFLKALKDLKDVGELLSGLRICSARSEMTQESLVKGTPAASPKRSLAGALLV